MACRASLFAVSLIFFINDVFPLESRPRPLAQVTPVERSWHVLDYPNPQVNITKCGRRVRRSWICDPNNLLKFEEANELDSLIADIQRDTLCPCSRDICYRDGRGYVISIALVNKLTTDSRQQGMAQQVENGRKFVRNLEKYNYAFDRCDEDVIIMYSRDDNIIYTLTGLKAREKLTDQILSDITRDATVYFMHNLFMGLKHMLYGIRSVLEGRYLEYRTNLQDMDTRYAPLSAAQRQQPSNSLSSSATSFDIITNFMLIISIVFVRLSLS
ncbi:uncharacterized protein LOC141914894 [Tubulanus polymorphus]|uniref:uncharacterized protein LOC141914894 n=1 Tax=Tubulanus polymorphus TaxID=672921 RepID=UPI003DA4A0FC